MPLIHPYTDLTNGAWLRGNLHTHSTRSDGERDPQAVIDDYARRGYGFLMMSDHDICTTPEQCGEWDARGMVLLLGNEVSANGPHLLHVDADRFIEPVKSRQEVIHAINAAAGETGRGFAIVNHPNWQGAFDHCTIHQMREWVGYAGLEVFNGVICRLDGSPYATNKWDILLSEGRRLWGFANDDSHAAVGDVELGWNTAYVKEKSVAGVVEALRSGRFYASTGVTITAIRVEGMTVRLETKDAIRITALTNVGKRIKTVDDRAIEVTVPPHARYLRFECWGAGERFAWTQPFFVEPGDAPGGAAKGAKAPVRYIDRWRVSNLVEHAELADASPEQAEEARGRSWHDVSSHHPGDARGGGFTDVREQVQGRPGVVYLSATIESGSDRRARLYLGYDGPVRVWVNNQQILDAPGTNPAVPDKVGLNATLTRGGNRLLIALDTNGGRAWGVYARVEK